MVLRDNPFEKRGGRSPLLRFKCVYVNSVLNKSYVWRRPVDDFIYFIMELLRLYTKNEWQSSCIFIPPFFYIGSTASNDVVEFFFIFS